MDKKIIFLILAIFLICLVSAVKPQPQIISNGCEIRLPQATTLRQNQDINLHTHVINTSSNASNFLTNVTTYCYIHLYNHSGHTFQENLSWDSNGLEWEIEISGGNFSQIGEFSFYIQCQAVDVICADSGAFEVTSNGKILTMPSAVLYSAFFFILIFVFTITIFGINKLPSGNKKDDRGNVIEINFLKYFRSTLWMFEWAIIIAILFISSNLAFAFLSEELFAKFLFALFQVAMGISPIIVIVWFIWIFAKIIQDKEAKKLLSRINFGKRM